MWNIEAPGVLSKSGVYAEADALERLIPLQYAFLFSTKPLLSGDNEAEYGALLTATILEFEPETFTEWIYVRDIVDALWKQRRLSAAERALIVSDIPVVANDVLGGFSSRYFSKEQRDRGIELVTQGMLRGDTLDKAAVTETLALGGLNGEALVAAAIARNMDLLAALDRLTENQRRHFRATLKDFSLHREARQAKGSYPARSSTSSSAVVLDG